MIADYVVIGLLGAGALCDVAVLGRVVASAVRRTATLGVPVALLAYASAAIVRGNGVVDVPWAVIIGLAGASLILNFAIPAVMFRMLKWPPRGDQP